MSYREGQRVKINKAGWYDGLPGTVKYNVSDSEHFVVIDGWPEGSGVLIRSEYLEELKCKRGKTGSSTA